MSPFQTNIVMRTRRSGARFGYKCSKRFTLVAFLFAAPSSCKGEFTGPYPCETGYASCVYPEQNQCETDITADGANCGTCRVTPAMSERSA